MSKTSKTFLFLVLAFLFPSAVFAAPSVSSVSGTITHGQTITVSGSQFGMKANADQDVPAAPLLWDVVSAQYRGGTNVNAYAGLNDGDHINTSIWQNISYEYQGQPIYGGEITEYATSRTMRHSRVSAVYNAYGTRGVIGTPRYVDGSPNPPGSQKRFYLSFYRRLKNPANGPGGGRGSTKIVRFEYAPERPGDYLGGSDFLSQLGWGGDAGIPPQDKYNWTINGPGTETTYVRWEVYLDTWYGGTGKGWLDVYKNGHFFPADDGNPKEFRPSADWRWYTGQSGYTYNAHDLDDNTAVVPGTIGFDSGEPEYSGTQETDLSEIYYDNTQARVEISDQPTWDISPTATANREVQGRLLTWGDNQITLELYQGAFDTLAGKYLYVIDEDGNANPNGYLLGSGDTTPPSPPTNLSVI